MISRSTNLRTVSRNCSWSPSNSGRTAPVGRVSTVISSPRDFLASFREARAPAPPRLRVYPKPGALLAMPAQRLGRASPNPHFPKRETATMGNMLENEDIVVTGAGNGIGRDFALALAAEGAKVVVNDIVASLSGEGDDAGPAQQVVAEIRKAGGEAAASTDSVSDWQSANRIVTAALDNFGRIDGVINNAGILRDRMFFKMNEEEWRSVIDVHLHGSFFVAR